MGLSYRARDPPALHLLTQAQSTPYRKGQQDKICDGSVVVSNAQGVYPAAQPDRHMPSMESLPNRFYEGKMVTPSLALHPLRGSPS